MPEEFIKMVLTISNQNGAHHMSSGDRRSRHMERLLQLASGVDHWGGGQEAARQAPRLTWLGNLTRRRLPRARSSGKSGPPPLRGWEAATEDSWIRGRHVAKVRLLYHHHSWSEFHE